MDSGSKSVVQPKSGANAQVTEESMASECLFRGVRSVLSSDLYPSPSLPWIALQKYFTT